MSEETSGTGFARDLRVSKIAHHELSRAHQRHGSFFAERRNSALARTGPAPGTRWLFSPTITDRGPERASLVAGPKGYHFCDYGEAVAMAGAVADYRPDTAQTGKIRSDTNELVVRLVSSPRLSRNPSRARHETAPAHRRARPAAGVVLRLR